MSRPVHPELRLASALLPRRIPLRLLMRLSRWASSWPREPPRVAGLLVRDLEVPGSPAGLRLYQPEGTEWPRPAVVWFHGGGFVLGDPVQDEASCISLARELQVAVAAVRYRLAPEHPFPAAFEDGLAALEWLAGQGAALGIDSARLAVAGVSAGGGLAAAVVQAAVDRGRVRPASQVLIYPMLDDRTVLRQVEPSAHRLWSLEANEYGWTAYLGRPPGSAELPPYAAPGRRQELGGLPPTWLGVGTNDLFHDEDVDLAARLSAAGIPTALEVVPGAFHGFDVVAPGADVSVRFRRSWVNHLRATLLPR